MKIFCIADTPEQYKEQWEKFVSGSLADINKKNAVELVSDQCFNMRMLFLIEKVRMTSL